MELTKEEKRILYMRWDKAEAISKLREQYEEEKQEGTCDSCGKPSKNSMCYACYDGQMINSNRTPKEQKEYEKIQQLDEALEKEYEKQHKGGR